MSEERFTLGSAPPATQALFTEAPRKLRHLADLRACASNQVFSLDPSAIRVLSPCPAGSGVSGEFADPLPAYHGPAVQ
jgi:hypothetical protein